jgi:hypothetical protein
MEETLRGKARELGLALMKPCGISGEMMDRKFVLVPISAL